MKLRGTYVFGFLIGLFFGTVGLWIIAMLSLVIPFVEYALNPAFLPGRGVARLLESDGSVGNVGVAFLFCINGIFYGVMGMGLQAGLRKLRS